MNARTLCLPIGGALVLLAGSFASAATLQHSMATDGATQSVAGDVLYSQLDDPSGSAVTDQTFEASYAAYDGTGADDFEVNVGGCGSWTIETIITPGSQAVAGSDPFFVSHAFYEDAGGIPGAILADCDFPANTDFTSAGDGDLSTNVDCEAILGTTWVSQTVRQDFSPFGQHFWATRATAAGNPAVWKNPGNGFDTGCLDWSPANAVCGQSGEDFLFELQGVELTGCGTVSAMGPVGATVLILGLGGGSAYVVRRRRA